MLFQASRHAAVGKLSHRANVKVFRKEGSSYANTCCDQQLAQPGASPMDVIGTVSANLHACLNEELDQLARDCNAIARERVFTGRSLLLMIVGTLIQFQAR
jgi:hypothetical protein